MRTPVLLMLLIGILSGCNNQNATVLPAKSSTVLNFGFGQEKTLTVEGASAKTVKIKFLDIKEGRCTGRQCETCYGGYAYTYFDVWSNNMHDTLTLSRISCVGTTNLTFDNPVIDRKNSQGLRIGLATISDNQSEKSRYKVALLISEL